VNFVKFQGLPIEYRKKYVAKRLACHGYQAGDPSGGSICGEDSETTVIMIKLPQHVDAAAVFCAMFKTGDTL
jgi:hypothetical protein